eukprot:TRINITY_DN6286_c0_g1_i1.p1 TRINITY_DN6286_c0_g1~~TRINITY_DN6286_c0_g1_i1.p1  ORF type:complete len:744 (+),score=79.80 TRINITY_DN6286_c0_g1_i1:26-2233(+)
MRRVGASAGHSPRSVPRLALALVAVIVCALYFTITTMRTVSEPPPEPPQKSVVAMPTTEPVPEDSTEEPVEQSPPDAMGPMQEEPDDGAFMGCEEIHKLVVEEKIGCGCVSCAYKATWRNITVVIKRLSNKAGRCDRRHSINLFRNMANFLSLRVRHPHLIKSYGVCRGWDVDETNIVTANGTVSHDKHKQEKESSAVVMEYIRGGELYLPKLEREPLPQKIRMVIGMAKLLDFFAIGSPTRPGSPYMMCDFKAQQFALAAKGGTTVKLVDTDMIIPMSRSRKYKVLPPKVKSQRSWRNGRIFTDYRCKLNTLCPMECLFGYKKDMSEYLCAATGAPAETAAGSGRCPGVGPKAHTYMFASNFLRGLLETHELKPRLAKLVTSGTSFEESERPEMKEVITELEAILSDEERSPSLELDYGAPLHDAEVYDLFLKEEDVKDIAPGKRLRCGCIYCANEGQLKGHTVEVLTHNPQSTCSLLGGTGGAAALHYLQNTVEMAILRVVHPLFLLVFGSAQFPKPTVIAESLGEVSPFSLRLPHQSLKFKVRTLLRVAYLVKYLSVLAVDRPGSPYVLCDFANDRFVFTRNGTTPKMVQIGMVIPLSLSLKCRALPPRVVRPPIYMHGRVWFQRHCTEAGKPVCEMECLAQYRERMSEFSCGSDGRCPGVSVPANVFIFGETMVKEVAAQAQRYEMHAAEATTRQLVDLGSRMTAFNEKERPSMDEVIWLLREALRALPQR